MTNEESTTVRLRPADVKEAWAREVHAQFAGSALSAELVDDARAGDGIVLAAILGLLFWLLIILATVSLVWAL